MKVSSHKRRAVVGGALAGFAFAGLTLTGATLAASAALGTGAPTPRSQDEQGDRASQQLLQGLSLQFRHVAELVEPSVVHVEIRGTRSGGQRPDALPEGFPDDFFRRFFEPGSPLEEEHQQTPRDGEDYRRYDVPETLGAGSGWVYDEQGHVVTNNHVVAYAEEVIVKTYDGAEHRAEVVATDPSTDVALLKIDAEELVPATLSFEPVEQGDIVFAFGSPLQIEFSMSQGIVAGKGRRTGILGPSGYESFIQTDAAINPGNSGGPLTDIYGRVVGMNSAILTRSGFFSGIGFAIPSSMIRPVIDQLIEHGAVSRGYLGVSIQDDPELLRSFGHDGRGVLISDVIPGGAAAEAGLERGDIVTRVNGEPVQTSDELRRRIAAERPGSVVELAVVRKGEQIRREVALGEMPAVAEESGGPTTEGEGQRPANRRFEPMLELGIERASALTPDVARRLGIEQVSGVLVQEVRPQSVAQQAGLSAGTIVTEVADASVASAEELADELARRDLARGVRLTVRVEGRNAFVFLKLPG